MRASFWPMGVGKRNNCDIIDFGENSRGKWELYKDGKIKQWGFMTAASYGPHTLQYPIPFKSKVDYITVQCYALSSNDATIEYLISGTGTLSSHGVRGSGSNYSAGNISGFYYEVYGE